MDKASKVLENLTTPQRQLPIGYQMISSNPLLIGKEINLDSSLSHPALLENDSLLSVPGQPLVKKSVDLASPSGESFSYSCTTWQKSYDTPTKWLCCFF